MKKIRVIHFWIGVVVSLFLLAESISGIFMYFQEQGKGERPFSRPAMMQQQNGNQQNSTSDNSQTKQNNLPNFPNGQSDRPNMDNMMQRSGSSSFGMKLRQLHNGVIGLIAGIGMLVLTITGLILSWVIAKQKRKRKKRMNNQESVVR